MATSDAPGDVGGTVTSRANAALLALLGGGVVGGAATANGAVSGLGVLGVVLGTAVLLGGLVALPALVH